jgi:hypothetical protein
MKHILNRLDLLVTPVYLQHRREWEFYRCLAWKYGSDVRRPDILSTAFSALGK